MNQIVVYDQENLSIVDVVKTSHPSEIVCLDVSTTSKDIVSYSRLVLDDRGEIERNLIVHGLSDQSCLNGVDAKITEEMKSALPSPTR